MAGVNIRLQGKLSSGRCHDGKDIVGREWMAGEVGGRVQREILISGALWWSRWEDEDGGAGKCKESF